MFFTCGVIKVTFGEYLRRHYLPARPGLSPGYCALLAATIQNLDDWAGRQVCLDCDRETLGSWLSHCLSYLRPSTVNDRARMVRSLQLAAWEDGLLPSPPKRSRRIPEYRPVPQAWTVSQVGKLLNVAQRSERADYWTSLVLVVYWTGCRIGALLGCRVEDYQDGGILVRRQKNGNQTWYALPLPPCQLLDRYATPRPPLSPIWPVACRRAFFRSFRRLVETAGIPAQKGGRNLFHKLRRTTLSYCAAADPAIAQRQADHADYRTTLTSYVDPRIARTRSAIDVLQDPLWV